MKRSRSPLPPSSATTSGSSSCSQGCTEPKPIREARSSSDCWRCISRRFWRGFDVLLLHAVNPHGFIHDLRTDAGNVNLNRNFSLDPSLYHQRNPDYAAGRWVFETQEPLANVPFGRLRTGAALAWSYLVAGFDAEGLNAYGGEGPRPQVEVLTRLLRPLIERYPDGILFLDVHTGLGEAWPAARHAVERRLGTVAGPPAGRSRATLVEHGVEVTAAGAPGFYPTRGDVSLAYDPTRVLGVTLGFGTAGTGTMAELRAASTIILENQARMRGCDWIRAEFREHFAPADPGWRADVKGRTDTFMHALIEGF